METGTINPNLDSTLHEHRVFPPPGRICGKGAREEPRGIRDALSPLYSGSAAFLGGDRQRTALVRSLDQACSIGILPRPGGSSAARSISATTASIVTPLATVKDKVAILWESEPGETRTLTYGELHLEVQKFANVLKGLGVRKGDRVAVYMGMTPELAIALLACARIGAVHSVIFGGFAANALVDRINDASCVALDYPGWIVPAGAGSTPEANCRRGIKKLPYGEACCRLSPHRIRREHEAGPRSMVARSDSQSPGRVPGRAAGRGRSAVHPLHIRNDRKTKRPGAHHRWLFGANLPDQQADLRSQSRTMCTGVRPILAGSPATPTLFTAFCRTASPR